MTVNLYKPYLGQVVKINGEAYQIIKVGPPLSCFPGERNICPATLKPYVPAVDPHGTEYGHRS